MIARIAFYYVPAILVLGLAAVGSNTLVEYYELSRWWTTPMCILLGGWIGHAMVILSHNR